jgi:hypothetical protein
MDGGTMKLLKVCALAMFAGVLMTGGPSFADDADTLKHVKDITYAWYLKAQGAINDYDKYAATGKRTDDELTKQRDVAKKTMNSAAADAIKLFDRIPCEYASAGMIEKAIDDELDKIMKLRVAFEMQSPRNAPCKNGMRDVTFKIDKLIPGRKH